MVDRRGPGTRVDQIVDHVARMIETGPARVGERLPSVRRAAEERGVSKNTMAEAYDRLVARGLLEARPGAGYFVARHASPAAATLQPHVAEAVDLMSLLREQFDQNYDIRPGDGRLPPSWMEGSELRRHFQTFRLPASHLVEFGYGSTRGFAPLRERIRAMLAERSVEAAPEGMLLTYGANHAFDLIIRRFVEPGDVVFVDSPGYYPLFAKLALAKAQIVGIPRNADGPDLDALREALALRRPKLFFTQSQAHNPTGAGLSPGVAFALLGAAQTHEFRIVEDDAFGDIMPASATRLASLDRLRRTLYVGTFAKTLSASLRSGFIAGDPDSVRALTDLKIITSVTTSDYVERFIFGLMHGGHYLRHVRRLRARLVKAREEAISQLRAIGFDVAPEVGAGFYVWAEFPEGVDARAIHARAAKERIFLAPGDVFYPDGGDGRRPATRINVASATDERLLSFLRRELRGG